MNPIVNLGNDGARQLLTLCGSAGFFEAAIVWITSQFGVPTGAEALLRAPGETVETALSMGSDPAPAKAALPIPAFNHTPKPLWALADPLGAEARGSGLNRSDVKFRWAAEVAVPAGEVAEWLLRAAREGLPEPGSQDANTEYRLAPHMLATLRALVELHLKLLGSAEKELMFSRALGVRADSVIFLTADAQIVGLNEEAEELLRARRGLLDAAGYLRAVAPADQQSLNQALESLAADTGKGETPRIVFALAREGGADRFRAKLAPLRLGPRPPGAPPRPEAVLFIDDLSTRPTFAPEPLIKMGLTHAEAALALDLVSGATLRSAAEKRGVSHETTRTQLKSIMHKLEVSRQTDLLRVLSRLLT